MVIQEAMGVTGTWTGKEMRLLAGRDSRSSRRWRAVIRQGGNGGWLENGSGCANPGRRLSFAKSCPEILLCDVGATMLLLTGDRSSSGTGRGCESRRRHDWGDGYAGYFKQNTLARAWAWADCERG